MIMASKISALSVVKCKRGRSASISLTFSIHLKSMPSSSAASIAASRILRMDLMTVRRYADGLAGLCEHADRACSRMCLACAWGTLDRHRSASKGAMRIPAANVVSTTGRASNKTDPAARPSICIRACSRIAHMTGPLRDLASMEAAAVTQPVRLSSRPCVASARRSATWRCSRPGTQVIICPSLLVAVLPPPADVAIFVRMWIARAVQSDCDGPLETRFDPPIVCNVVFQSERLWLVLISDHGMTT
jgi:hypothetical protein